MRGVRRNANDTAEDQLLDDDMLLAFRRGTPVHSQRRELFQLPNLGGDGTAELVPMKIAAKCG